MTENKEWLATCLMYFTIPELLLVVQNRQIHRRTSTTIPQFQSLSSCGSTQNQDCLVFESTTTDFQSLIGGEGYRTKIV